MRHEEFNLTAVDIRSLDPAQRDALKRLLVRRAHAARARATRHTLVRLAGLLRRLAGSAIAKVWTAYAVRRDRQLALAQLRGMTDCELRDIALSRSQIRAAAFSEPDDARSRDGSY